MRIVASQTYVRARPNGDAPRLGVVVRGARFRYLGARTGSGCRGPWYKLAPTGYVCSEQARLVRGSPGGPRLSVPAGRRLPFRYVLVGPDGAGEYASVEDALADSPMWDLQPGFGRAVIRRLRREGEALWETRQGTFLLAADVFEVGGSRLRGRPVRGRRDLPVAIVFRRGVRAAWRPGLRRGRRLGRWSIWRVGRSLVLRGRGRWYELEGAGWVPDFGVRVARVSQPPAGLGPTERWVDVDLSQQVLVAYEGPRPVYVTLVSAGRQGRTPVGLFRVWAKLALADMERVGQDLEPEQEYSMRDVPWTMYFKGGYALHAAYWHDRFGMPHSHGCINLAPRDAKWLFEWSPPSLPPGWRARLPAPGEPSLVVRVRRGPLRGKESPCRCMPPSSLWPSRLVCMR